MAGRPATPTKIKKLKGTDQPCRILKNEINPAHITLPSPPDWLHDYAKDEWYIVTQELEALQILSKMDLSMLATYCHQIATIREATQQLVTSGFDMVLETPNGALQPNPLLGIINKSTDVALKIAGQFGFTPAARTRIGAPGVKQKDPFDEFLGS